MAVDPSTLDDPAKLRTLAVNAKARGREDIWFASLARIADLAGLAFEPGIESDFLKAVKAAEEFRSAEVGKTVRLSRTRQKIDRVGVMQTVIDLAKNPKISEGFRILVRGGRPDLTAEAIVLRHEHLFDVAVVTIAREKLATIENIV